MLCGGYFVIIVCYNKSKNKADFEGIICWFFHGSSMEVPDPICDYSDRDDLDFGQGFYVTLNREEAEDWAISKTIDYPGEPTVNIYELDDSYDCDSAYKLFDDTDEELFDFLEHCRGGEIEYMSNEYSIVEGKVADDSGFAIFEAYQDGEISRQEALDDLISVPLGDQICFRTDEAIQAYLHFVTSERA